MNLTNIPNLDGSERNNSLFSYACSLQAKGVDDFNITQSVEEANQVFIEPLDNKEVNRLIKSAITRYEKGVPFNKQETKKEPKKEIDTKDQRREHIEDYDYTDENGNIVFRKERHHIFNKVTNDFIKKVTPYRDFVNRDENNKPLKNLDRLEPELKATLYNRLGIKKARESKEPLYITEGEKDANTLIKKGLNATCLKSPKEKLSKYHLDQLQGINTIYIIPDKDIAGYKASSKLFDSLNPYFKDIYTLYWYEDIVKANKGTQEFEKRDITDQVEANGIGNNLEKFIKDNSIKGYPDLYRDLIDPRPFNTSFTKLCKLLKVKGQQWLYEYKFDEIQEGKNVSIPPSVIADILIETCYFTLLGKKSDTAPIAVYDTSKGIYTTSKRHLHTLINSVETVSINKQSEILNQLIIKLHSKEEYNKIFTDSNYSIFGNGIYNKETKRLEAFTPRKIYSSTINVRYNPKAKEPVFKDWSFSDWITNDIATGNGDKYKLIWQLIGKSLRPNLNKKVAFFLYDENTNTGKSTFSQLLSNLIGEENTSGLDLEQIEERFSPATAEGKALIIGDDNDREMNIDKSNNFKRITSGELMTVERKGENAYETRFNTTIVQSMNGLPKFKTVDKGLLGRIRVIRFAKEYKDNKDLNPRVKEEYIYNQELLEYIAYIAINTDLSTIVNTDESMEILKDLATLGDPIKTFYDEVIINLSTTTLPPDILFKVFKDWAEFEEGIKPKISQRSFTNKLKEHMLYGGWSYKNKKLDQSFQIDELENIWLDIKKSDIEGGTKPNNGGLDLYLKTYREYIENGKQKKCFVKIDNWINTII